MGLTFGHKYRWYSITKKEVVEDRRCINVKETLQIKSIKLPD